MCSTYQRSSCSMFDTAGTVKAPLDLRRTPPQVERSKKGANGTTEPLAQNLPSAGVSDSRNLSTSGETALSEGSEQLSADPLKVSRLDVGGRDLSGRVGRVGDGIRTRDTQIHNLNQDSRKGNRVKNLRSSTDGVAPHLPHDNSNL